MQSNAEDLLDFTPSTFKHFNFYTFSLLLDKVMVRLGATEQYSTATTDNLFGIDQLASSTLLYLYRANNNKFV